MPSTTSLIYTDGFDYYTDVLTKWTSADTGDGGYPIQTPGRFGYGQRLTLEAPNFNSRCNLQKIFPNAPYSRIVAGTAVRYDATSLQNGGTPVIGLVDVNTNIIFSVGLGSLGVLGATIGGTAISSNPLTWPFNGWFYLEFDAILSTSGSGSLEIRCNGQTVGSASGLTFTANECYGLVLLAGAGTGQMDFDDIYVLAPNTTVLGDSFLGDVKIVPLIPSGNGEINQFTQTGGVTGQHWTSVDDVPPDDDNSYVSSNTPGQIDMYTLPTPNSITPTSAVYGVAAYALSRKDDSPARFLSVGVGNGTTESFDSGAPLGSTYSYVQKVFPINPITGQAWTLNDFNTLQVGVKLVS